MRDNEYLDYCQDVANSYLCDTQPINRLHVSDWDKWISAKKKASITLVVLGIFLGFGVESSLWWGVTGVAIAIFGASIMQTIDRNDW